MRIPQDPSKRLVAKPFMKSPNTRSGSESSSHTTKTCLNTIPNKHPLTPECLTPTQPDNAAVLLTAGSGLLHLEILQQGLGVVNIYPHIINRIVIKSLKVGLKETSSHCL